MSWRVLICLLVGGSEAVVEVEVGVEKEVSRGLRV
jgi:hypothetical protein